MRETELVSIITPMYNAERFIEHAIRSVLAQTYTNWEMLITDDCSNDGSCAIVERYSKVDPRIKLIKMPKNSGVVDARNASINIASGKYIAFLDADDIWLPSKIETQLKFMQENQSVLSYSAYKKIDEDGKIISDVIPVPSSTNFRDLLYSNTIPNLTAMYDASVLGKVYTPHVKHEDYALWLSILQKGNTGYGIKEPLALYRVRKSSVSGNKLRAASYQWKIYRNFLNFRIFKSIYYFMWYTVYGFRKKVR